MAGGCWSNPKPARIFWTIGHPGKAAMIFSSPSQQFVLGCMSISNMRSRGRARRMRPGRTWGNWLLDPVGVAAGNAGAVALHARLGCDRFDNVAPGRAVTRPRGVTVGDFLDKPRADGGLEMSRYVAAAVLAVLILAAITLLPKRAERVRVAD